MTRTHLRSSTPTSSSSNIYVTDDQNHGHFAILHRNWPQSSGKLRPCRSLSCPSTSRSCMLAKSSPFPHLPLLVVALCLPHTTLFVEHKLLFSFLVVTFIDGLVNSFEKSGRERRVLTPSPMAIFLHRFIPPIHAFLGHAPGGLKNRVKS
jgi:hypothetical protein